MQSGELVRFEGRPPASAAGATSPGLAGTIASTEVADGWLRVQAPSLAALGEALGLHGSAREDGDAIAERAGSHEPRERAGAAAAAGHSAAHRPPDDEVVHDPPSSPWSFSRSDHFPDGRPYLVPHRYARFSRTEQAPIGDAPGVGEHSRDVLARGRPERGEIDALVEERVVIQGAPFVLTALINYR